MSEPAPDKEVGGYSSACSKEVNLSCQAWQSIDHLRSLCTVSEANSISRSAVISYGFLCLQSRTRSRFLSRGPPSCFSIISCCFCATGSASSSSCGQDRGQACASTLLREGSIETCLLPASFLCSCSFHVSFPEAVNDALQLPLYVPRSLSRIAGSS